MSDTPKISVIIPMYNAEKYLRTCIESVLNQTFTDFELILIDDCSTDKTLEIAKSFDDPRIRLICNEKNLGSPGVVRNVGLDVARGEFLYFIDNDDAILATAFDTLMNKMNETGADIIYSCRWMIPNDPEFTQLEGLTGVTQATSMEPVSKDLKVRIWNELCKNHMHSVGWLCLYRRKLFDNENGKIRFPDYLAEDVFVHFDLLCTTDNIVKIDFPFYIYRVHENSLTHNKKNIGRAIDSTMALVGHIRRKLVTLTSDEPFINNSCLSLLNGVSSIYLQPLFLEDSTKIFHEIEDHYTEKFSDYGTNIALLFYAYLWGQNESIKRTNFRTELQGLMERNP